MSRRLPPLSRRLRLREMRRAVCALALAACCLGGSALAAPPEASRASGREKVTVESPLTGERASVEISGKPTPEALRQARLRAVRRELERAFAYHRPDLVASLRARLSLGQR